MVGSHAILGMLLVGAASTAITVSAYDRQPSLSPVVGMVEAVAVPLFTPTTGMLFVRNPHATRSMEIEGIASSCDCLEIAEAGFALEPGQTRVIPARIAAMDVGSPPSVEVTIKTADDHVIRVPVVINIIPPVAGWPDSVCAQRAQNRLDVSIAPAYREMVSAATAYPRGSDSGIEGLISADGSVVAFLLPSGFGAEIDIALDFTHGRWCRPVSDAPAPVDYEGMHP